MRILGDWNWWLPGWAARVLFVRREPGVAGEPALETE